MEPERSKAAHLYEDVYFQCFGGEVLIWRETEKETTILFRRDLAAFMAESGILKTIYPNKKEPL